MAYIDDLTSPLPGRKGRPLVTGAAPVAPPAPAPLPAPVPYKKPTGPNTPVEPLPKHPPSLPPPVVPPPQPPQGGIQATTQNATTPPPPPTEPNQGTNTNYAATLDALYKKYFYRAPTAGELQAHLGNLTTPGHGTIRDIEAELAREAARLQLKPPTTTPPAQQPPPVQQPAPYKRTRQNMPPGLDMGKWLSGHQSPKYAWAEVASQFNMKTPQGRQQALQAAQTRFPQWFAGAKFEGDILSGLTHKDFDGITAFDVLRDQEGDAARSWRGVSGNVPVVTPPPSGQGGGGTAPYYNSQTGMYHYPDGKVSPTPLSGYPNPATPNQGGLALNPLTGQLGGAGGLDFGITGEYGYDDPNTRKLEEFLRLMIDEKTNPIEDPARTEYANAMRQRFQSLIAPGSGTNDGAVDLDRQLQSAIASLTDPALTENDRSRLENRALEPMERDRQIRLQQEKERLAARGLGESSGIITESLASVDQDFDRRRGEVQRDLSIYEREQEDARRREAIDFGTQRRNVIGTELDREQGRYGQALTMAEALSNLSGQQRTEQDARQREALTYVSLFPEMDERRLRLAMDTLGMSSSMANGSSIFNTLGQLSAQANAAAQQGQSNNAAFWGQMGQWMANAWPQDGGAS